MSIEPEEMTREALIREVLASRSAGRAGPNGSRPTGRPEGPPRAMPEVGEPPEGERSGDAAKDSRTASDRLQPMRRKASPEDRLTHTRLMSEITPRLRALKAFTAKILRDLKQKKPRDLVAIDERNRLLIELQGLGTTLDSLGRSGEPARR